MDRSIVLAKLVPGVLILLGCSITRPEAPTVAFFYGRPVPIKALSHYDYVVLEAENLPSLDAFGSNRPVIFAYLSIGEAEGWRASAGELDSKLFLGKNAAWGSRIADLTQQGWTEFLIEKRIKPLWQQGFRAFFLDTLDSYQIPVKDPEGRALQARALANIVREIHDRFPGVRLLLNRGFDILPDIGHLVDGVVAESLFQGWDATSGKYVKVQESDRTWLLAQLQTIGSRYRLPVTVIDYVSPLEPGLALDTAKRIRELGFAAWVATPSLDTLSVEPTK
ncbi:endo alpha-1,4 polygalactosaminidase [Massilia sp. WG5]|uniref:endo alpha-1,4 polygalactosaminidase n=1 Tax=Massilia sp. WG5 TaxID=1707785 RepID=UPI000761FBC3|nr:endo alpha-1,4 polygalactosaminidase [Massilia sp. WG5]ALK99773.2 hypothetical protein AM586_21850 [Massilia sp. WG5]